MKKSEFKSKSDLFFAKVIESLFGTGLKKIFAIILPFVIVKLFGASLYGEFIYYFTVAMMLSVFTKVGLDTGLIYYIPKKGIRYVSGSFLIVIVLSVFLGTVYASFENSFVKYILMFIFLSIHALFLALNRSSGRIKEYFLIDTFIRQGLTIVCLVFLYLKKVENGILIAYTIGYIIADIVLYIHNRASFKKIDFSKELMIYSFPLMITSGMSLLMNNIDVLMIKQYLDVTTLGIYNIAAKVATLPAVLLLVFNTAFAPKISQLYHNNQINELTRIYTISSRVLMGISFVIIVMIMIFNQFILGFFGDEFLQASNVVLFRAIGQLVSSSVGSVWYMLSMTGKSKLNMIGTSSAAVINIILNFILIPRMGIDGAAIASMIAVSFINIMGYALVKKHFDVKVFGIF